MTARPCSAIVLALGGDDPAAFASPALLPLGGASLLQRLLGVLAEAGIPGPLVVAEERHARELQRVLGEAGLVTLPDAPSRPGVRSRRLEALRVALEHLGPGDDPVLVHEVGRALTPASLVETVLSGLDDGSADACVPGIAVTDSVKRVATGAAAGLSNVDRAGLTAVQSPRALRRSTLEAAIREGGLDPATHPDDEVLRAAALGHRVRVVHGSHRGGVVDDRLSLWQAQIALGLARDTRAG